MATTQTIESKHPSWQRVLLVAELFEAILLQLPHRDLLLAQAVSRHWRDTILTSPRIQQKLFFQPVSNTNHGPELNPLLQWLLPPFFGPQINAPYATTDAIESFTPNDAIKNLGWYADQHYRDIVLRREASWRRMYPVQPPARIESSLKIGECCLQEFYETPVEVKGHQRELQQEGAQMGLLYDVIVHLLNARKESLFRIRWLMFPISSREDLGLFRYADDEKSEGEIRGGLKQANKISIHNYYQKRCGNRDNWDGCGLNPVEFGEDIVQYGERRRASDLYWYMEREYM